MNVATTGARPDSRTTTGRPNGRDLSQPAPASRGSYRFYVCLIILATTAATMEMTARWFGARFTKLPVELKRPLALMDKNKLGPEYGIHDVPPATLDADMLESLGTEEYLSWMIVDKSRAQSDPLCTAHVFVTYFTGQPDLVPHVPDECMRAAGFDPTGPADTVEVRVPGVGAPNDLVPVRVLTFLAPRRGPEGLVSNVGAARGPTAMYFFHTNGQYVTTRNQVRQRCASLFERYAYYMKVEVSFSDYNLRSNAPKEDSIQALGPLLGKLLPILLEDHLQDWETWTAEDRTAAAIGNGGGEG